MRERVVEMNERVIDMHHKMDYMTDSYVVPAKDKMKAEACAVLKHPDDGSYYVIRRQLGSLQSQVNIKKKAGFEELVRYENPNSVNLLVRLKETGRVSVVVNTVRLLDITEAEFLELVREINDEKKTSLD